MAAGRRGRQDRPLPLARVLQPHHRGGAQQARRARAQAGPMRAPGRPRRRRARARAASPQRSPGVARRPPDHGWLHGGRPACGRLQAQHQRKTRMQHNVCVRADMPCGAVVRRSAECCGFIERAACARRGRRRRRWLVFDSPPDTPFRLGNVTWARHGGCECNCDDVDQCARYGLAPAVGTGLAAQHICRRRVEEARPARAARRAPPGRACHAGARAGGAGCARPSAQRRLSEAGRTLSTCGACSI